MPRKIQQHSIYMLHEYSAGQMYNKDGLLQPWWTPKSQQNFNEKKLCFAKQYSAFEVFGFHVSLQPSDSAQNVMLDHMGGGAITISIMWGPSLALDFKNFLRRCV